MSRHKCPVLSGCVISCTGYTSDERTALQELITTNGASYNGQLTKDTSTHLLVGSTTCKAVVVNVIILTDANAPNS